MACTRPLKAYRAAGGGISFASAGESGGYADRPLQLPCGKCVSCRLERSRQWSVRMYHEMLMASSPSSFVTLTYSPEKLPTDLSLDVRHWQLFAKRLRKRMGKFRFYMCGEYGEKNRRPHYHAMLFGLSFVDRKLWKVERGNQLYTSEILEKTWSHGFTSVGDASPATCAYVARYVQKKVGKPHDDVSAEDYIERYGRWNDRTGEFWTVRPEFATMSKGIGRSWLEKYKSDVYPHDNVVMHGRKYRPPRYYDEMLDEEELKIYKGRRARAVAERGMMTDRGLRSLEKHKEAQAGLLQREV